MCRGGSLPNCMFNWRKASGKHTKPSRAMWELFLEGVRGVSLYIPDWPRTHNVAQAGLSLNVILLPQHRKCWGDNMCHHTLLLLYFLGSLLLFLSGLPVPPGMHMAPSLVCISALIFPWAISRDQRLSTVSKPGEQAQSNPLLNKLPALPSWVGTSKLDHLTIFLFPN